MTHYNWSSDNPFEFIILAKARARQIFLSHNSAEELKGNNDKIFIRALRDLEDPKIFKDMQLLLESNMKNEQLGIEGIEAVITKVDERDGDKTENSELFEDNLDKDFKG